MHCTCVRQSDLPNTTRLFADVLYHPDRTAPFYRYPLRGLDDFRAAAGEIQLSGDRRAGLVAALQAHNAPSPALPELAEAGAVPRGTGQQRVLYLLPRRTPFRRLYPL